VEKRGGEKERSASNGSGYIEYDGMSSRRSDQE
jgi:hypothetical protein